jgi:hypothetical protein
LSLFPDVHMSAAELVAFASQEAALEQGKYVEADGLENDMSVMDITDMQRGVSDGGLLHQATVRP